ncbi:efflux transporter outer membrane subunit [Kordiimonas pumila]|uniref:Efflux transporter outer membrane subunit n=1 Tax=Kordiimonas pumila TaxID=2161677 RepID=A0ABV7CZF5_9PROT|nr:efflux transporter outer membrane subunit [Kordiimonas pumila]
MKKTSLLLIPTLLASACTMTPQYEQPTVQTPAAWHAQTPSPETAELAYDWWKSFNSNELDQLMATALSLNTDLLSGVQRVRQARASLKIAGADILPSISGSAGAGRTIAVSGGSTSATSLQAGVGVAYELDLFGTNKASVMAAKASYAAAQFDQEALALVVMGDVAQSYFTLLNLYERLRIADENLANAREVRRIINVRVQEGAESELELAQQESAVASREAARASLVESVANAQNALAVLLGQPPQTLDVVETSLQTLAVPHIAAGQPSALLARRPDLQSAEQGLIAANANIGIAKAALFPSLSLSAGYNFSAAGFNGPSSSALSLASSLVAPIFEGGRLKGGVELAKARQLELVETYRGTVLTAFQEVEDALSAIEAASIRETVLETAMKQAQKAYRLSKSRYDEGAIDFQTLLDTQDTLLSAEDSYAQAKLAKLTAAISLYMALGGGWQTDTLQS